MSFGSTSRGGTSQGPSSGACGWADKQQLVRPSPSCLPSAAPSRDWDFSSSSPRGSCIPQDSAQAGDVAVGSAGVWSFTCTKMAPKALNPSGRSWRASRRRRKVIANDRACRQLQEAVGKSRRLCLEVEATVTRFRAQRQKRLGMGTSCIRAPDGGCPEEPLSPALVDKGSWSQRRGAMSVDSITDLSDNASKLLEALQLSHPHELDPRRSRGKKKPLSLNPISWQVPRIVDRCCTHLETHGLQTVGIFRVGSSKKRVQQLREEFDRGLDVFLDEHQSVHDVAALLKEFLRDMPDSLIPRELYGAFLSTATLEGPAQLDTLQLLLFLLPPCHSDTLLRLLRFLAKVAQHAESSWDPEGRKIPGNKMTVSNLATVFGPNILQKEKPGEKDAGALNFEDSAAIILVLQRLIEHHHSLFMVSPEMQCDVLRRLFQTDPDVIEYLLRRKFPDMPSPECEDPGQDLALSALPGWTHSLERGSVSSELYSNVSFLNLDVGI
ncbi:rho GTPase-activating protein 36 isoform X3 [Pyrgilauda ruficollis]|uniref:rho GTPase-activating protein 36 isoform X3 n=2 Tax=Pyrgilauda ruficollis TaxID=221976 RepID=UPI001B868EDE|nr:rho GTPase-activating protein 36 isoform X3 [Pyrgilauda ruficollis]